MLRSTLACLAVTAVSVVGVPSALNAQQGPAQVIVEPVREVEVAETQALIARLVAMNQSIVATRIPGIVGDVMVSVGTSVERGDTLVRLDTELLSIELEGAVAALEQAQANVEAARATFEAADNAFDRIDGLQGSAAFSQGLLDDLSGERSAAEAEMVSAQAAIAVARAELQKAEYNQRNAAIMAPFSGVVVERQANLGAYLDVGAPVLTLIDDEALEIEADVPTEIVAALSAGDEVSAVLDDGTLGVAVVRAVVPNENPSTRTRPVRFRLQDTEGGKPLAAGQSVILQAPVGDERTALTVPKDALVQQAGGWIIFVARDGAATPVPVTIGAAVGDRFEVRGSLDAGEMTIVRGNERLRPGQPVAFEPPAGDASAVAEDAAEAQETVAAGSAEAPASGTSQ